MGAFFDPNLLFLKKIIFLFPSWFITCDTINIFKLYVRDVGYCMPHTRRKKVASHFLTKIFLPDFKSNRLWKGNKRKSNSSCIFFYNLLWSKSCCFSVMECNIALLYKLESRCLQESLHFAARYVYTRWKCKTCNVTDFMWLEVLFLDF